MKNNPNWAWQFFGCGFAVAFLVMVVLWWMECKRSEKKTVANRELVRQGNELVKHMGVLQNENDSLYRQNDSLKRVIVYIRTDSSYIPNPFTVTGTPITHSGKLYIDTTKSHYVGHDLPKH